MMHGDILPAIPIVTPIYAVTAQQPAITMATFACYYHDGDITCYYHAMSTFTCYYHAMATFITMLLRPISFRQNGLYSVYSKKSRFSMKKMN